MKKDHWITKCTTTGYTYPFFFPPKKKREEEKENKVAKPVLNTYIGTNRFSPKSDIMIKHIKYCIYCIVS